MTAATPVAIDVTDATFETEVLARSRQVPVVVDLWASWCGPCQTLGPVLERVVAATGGTVALAKVDVDANPQCAAAFQVQSIPAVYALRDGAVVDSFIGAQGEPQVQAFVDRLAPPDSEAERLVAKGDEASLRAALDLDPGHVGAVTALAEVLLARGCTDEALELLARVPETAETRRLAATARLGGHTDGGEDLEGRVEDLLERAGDEEARRELVDLLEVLGPEDPRAARWRRALASRLH